LKKLMITFLAIAAAINVQAFAQDASDAKIIAYYFHGSFRCPTCVNMEKYAREAIETGFKDALASGKLEFRAVNVEERGNEHFAKDYKLYTKSLILSLIKKGKEVRYKNLNKIWQLAGNKQKFVDYVSTEVSEFMKEAQ